MNNSKNSWDTLQELQDLLPPLSRYKSKGSIDRYGFLHLLAARCGLAGPLRPFAEWVHGWMWDDEPTALSMAMSRLDRKIPSVVRNEREKIALLHDGFKKVEVGGLPFAYVGKQHESRNQDALLAFPPHSSEGAILSDAQSDYLDYLFSLRHDFSGIYVCIFGLDWGGALHLDVQRRGLCAIRGADPNDKNSLYRVRAILDAFRCVTSNNIGSHFVYSLHAGCMFSICGPQYDYSGQLRSKASAISLSAERLDRIIEINSNAYLRGRFGRFFVDHPLAGKRDDVFGQVEVGFSHVLSREQVRIAVGWTPMGQVNGYISGLGRRARRMLGEPSGR